MTGPQPTTTTTANSEINLRTVSFNTIIIKLSWIENTNFNYPNRISQTITTTKKQLHKLNSLLVCYITHTTTTRDFCALQKSNLARGLFALSGNLFLFVYLEGTSLYFIDFDVYGRCVMVWINISNVYKHTCIHKQKTMVAKKCAHKSVNGT